MTTPTAYQRTTAHQTHQAASITSIDESLNRLSTDLVFLQDQLSKLQTFSGSLKSINENQPMLNHHNADFISEKSEHQLYEMLETAVQAIRIEMRLLVRQSTASVQNVKTRMDGLWNARSKWWGERTGEYMDLARVKWPEIPKKEG